MFRSVTAAAVTLLVAVPATAASDPAAVVGEFDDALIAAMQAGKTASLAARTTKLLPQVKATHDLPGMTRRVVGPVWATTGEADQKAVTDAFTRHSAVTYAVNFSSFDGEKFIVAPKVDTRGTDALVHVKLVSKDKTTPLDFRLHQTAEGWRIVDIIFDDISQIAQQRAEFAATVKAGGAAGLAAKLKAADDAQVKK